MQTAVPVTVTGTASDIGGAVGGVEVSVDGGATWHPATGREVWSYIWTPDATGVATLKSRAVDDSGNLANVPPTGTSVTVVQDTTPPTVTSVSPVNNASGVVTGTSLTATFSEAMNIATFTTNTFELRDPSNNLVPATVSYNETTKTARLDPTIVLAHSTTYTATISGGGNNPRAKDLSGNALVSDATWSFTTVSSPAEGPGGPILIIASSANQFTRYYAEILRAEGLNEFAVTDISSVSAGT